TPQCQPSYQWKYTTPTGPAVLGTSNTIVINPTQAGTYTVTVKGTCGTQRCDSIRIYVKVDTATTKPCVIVVRDSVICLSPQGQHQRYKFTLVLNNPTGPQCNMLQIVPQIVNSGIVLNVSHSSLPTGTTVVTGELTDFVPANNPFCLRIICTQGTKKCEIVYCLPLPSCDGACQCGVWDSTKVTFGATTKWVLNGGTVTGVTAPKAVTITPNLTCVPSNCSPTYQWLYSGPSSGWGFSTPIQITPTQPGTYAVIVVGKCGTQWCDSIRIFVKVDSVKCDSTLNTIFYNEQLFVSSLSTSQLVDFSTQDNGNPITSPSADQLFTSWTRSGITFMNFRSYYNQFIYTYPNAFISIVLPSGLYKKVGFKMSTFYSVDGKYTIKVHSGKCLYTYVVNGQGSTSYYFGINSPTPIDKIEVSHDQTYVVIDDFRFGN
ncbi:MAG: hypothetical protein AAB393_09365, partial [Bacteroidota bacterium]